MKREKKLISKKEFFKRVNLKARKIQALALLYVNIVSVVFFIWAGACYFDVISKQYSNEPLSDWNFWQKIEKSYYENLPQND